MIVVRNDHKAFRQLRVDLGKALLHVRNDRRRVGVDQLQHQPGDRFAAAIQHREALPGCATDPDLRNVADVDRRAVFNLDNDAFNVRYADG